MTGGVLIVDDIQEKIPTRLENIIYSNYIKKNQLTLVLLDEMQIEVYKNVKVFVTCNLPNPRFQVDTYNKVITLLSNFKALGNQFLSNKTGTSRFYSHLVCAEVFPGR